MTYLVFDIGGTNTRIAVFEKGTFLEVQSYPTINSMKLLGFLDKKTVELKEKYKIRKFEGIGISAPGFLEQKKLNLRAPVNLPKIKNLKFSSLKKYTEKIVLEHDANCAVIGALKKLKCREKKEIKNIVCLTIGTGLGCGIILNNNLCRGEGAASEFGHTIVDVEGEKCTCGNKGCLENYVSLRGFLKIAKKNGLNSDWKEINSLARKSDKKALKTYKEFGKNISLALVNIANTLDPEFIILTGGFCNNKKFFISEAKKEAEKKYFRGIKPKVRAFKENLSLLGAAELVK